MREHTHWAARLRRQTRQTMARQVRRMSFDANPLRRGTDRVEAWLRIGLVAAFLIVGPVAAIAVGHWASDSGARAARAQAAAEHRVRAVLLNSVPASSTYPAAGSWVRARWTAPNGTSHTGDVWAGAGTRAGSVMTVWADASGKLVNPPIGHAQIVSRVISFVAVTPAVLAVLLLNILWVTRRMLDRRRLAAWETGWVAVEPQWTRRAH
jgi:hypothetical protein